MRCSMIYALATRKYTNQDRTYTLYETSTDSSFIGNKLIMQRIVSISGKSLNNVDKINDEETNKLWYNKTYCNEDENDNGFGNILLCKVTDNKYKLVDYGGSIIYKSRKKLIKYIEEKRVSNCEIRDNRIVSIGTYRLVRDIQFEQEIAEKYNRYVAKSTILGCKMSFDYRGCLKIA